MSWQKGQVEGPCRQRARPQRRKAEGGRLKEYTGREGVNEDTHVDQIPRQRVCYEGHGADED